MKGPSLEVLVQLFMPKAQSYLGLESRALRQAVQESIFNSINDKIGILSLSKINDNLL